MNLAAATGALQKRARTVDSFIIAAVVLILLTPGASLSLSLSPFRETKGLLFDVRTIATGWIQVFGAIAAALGMYCEYCLCGTPPARLFSVIAADLSTFVMLVR